MTRYIMRRLLSLIPILFGVTLIVFLVLKFVPGDPAQMAAGPDATREEVENVRRALGLDKPLHVQYVTFLWNAMHGDFGRSLRTRRIVLEEVGERFPYTVLLALAATLVSLVVGIPAGIISAVKRYSIWDNLSMVGALLGVSLPGFWLGLMLMLAFSVQLGWFPTSGAESPRHLVLPAVTLGLGSAAMVARQTRSAMLDVLNQEYIRTARAKGLHEQAVIMRHGLKNALIPVVTVVGLQMGAMLAGTVLIEMVFAWPGIGRLLIQSIGYRDFPMVQACILLLATTFVLINLAVDVLYVYLDPRIKYG